MNSLVVYFSKFGNTQMVAEAIAETLAPCGDVRLLSSEELTQADLGGLDLLVMGSPTHKMNLPDAVRPVFENLPKHILRGTLIATFDTSYKMSWWLNHFTAGKKIAQKLRRLGGKLVLPAEIFHVTGREGPLYEGELERARDWARSILASSKLATVAPNVPSLQA